MDVVACPTCSGATDVPDGAGGIMPCPECQNSGNDCPLCHGKGTFRFNDGVAFLGAPNRTVDRWVEVRCACSSVNDADYSI